MRVKSVPVKSLASSLSSEVDPSYHPRPELSAPPAVRPRQQNTVWERHKTTKTRLDEKKHRRRRHRHRHRSISSSSSSSSSSSYESGRSERRHQERSLRLVFPPKAAAGCWDTQRDSVGELGGYYYTAFGNESKREWQKTVLAACVLSASASNHPPPLQPLPPWPKIGSSGGAFSSVCDRESVSSVSSVGREHAHAMLGVQFIDKAIIVLGADSTKVPTQKQIQRQGMTTTKQQKARAFLKQTGTIIVNTRTELSPRFPTLGHVQRHLRALLAL